MISAIILDSDQKEQLKIEKDLKNLIAYHTDEFLEIHYFSEYKSFITYLETAELLDLAVIDVVLSDGLRAAEKIHKYFPDAEIMLVADLSVSPVKIYASLYPGCFASFAPSKCGVGKYHTGFFSVDH